MITVFYRLYFFPSLAECNKTGKYVGYKNCFRTVKEIVTCKLELTPNSLGMLDS